MKDDSFVVETFVKNVEKNYENHKWIEKSFQFSLQSDEWAKIVVKEFFKVELNTRQKAFLPVILLKFGFKFHVKWFLNRVWNIVSLGCALWGGIIDADFNDLLFLFFFARLRWQQEKLWMQKLIDELFEKNHNVFFLKLFHTQYFLLNICPSIWKRIQLKEKLNFALVFLAFIHTQE